MNKEEALQKYESHFDEPLYPNYTRSMTDKKIIEVVEESIKKNKTYHDIILEALEKEFGKEVAENADIF